MRQAAPKELQLSKDGHDTQTRLLYKPDGEYRVPKVSVNCIAETQAVKAESVAAAAETTMLTVALADALEVSLYHAGLAGYSWKISADSTGLSVGIGGYSGDGLENLAQQLAKAISEPPALSKGRFEALLNLTKRETNSARHADLFQVGRTYLTSQALVTPAWSWHEQLEALDAVTWEAVVERGKKIQAESAVTCLAQGDISDARAQVLAAKLHAVLSLKELPRKMVPLPAIVAVPKQTELTELRRPALVANESNSLVLLVYQLEPVSCPGDNKPCSEAWNQAATMLLLSQVANQRAFNELRTKQSLGYVVFAWAQPSAVEKAGGKTLWSLRMMVQSGVKGASYVRDRMTEFLEGFLKKLQSSSTAASKQEEAVTDADIELAKHGLVASLLKRPDSLSDEASRMWTELLVRREDWARPWELAKVLLNVSRSDCAETLQQLVRPGKAARRAAIEVWRTKDGDPFSNSSSAMHLDDASAMQDWKKKVGSWSSEL
jgi:insulysin